MSTRRLTLACAAYDRTTALRTGEVSPTGIDLTYLTLPVEETFHRMVRFAEFDAAELSLSSYVLTMDRPDPPFVAIPVFPSRSFRHGGIYVNTSAGIRTPEDLAGRIVGLPEYQLTANVWIRGVLEDDYDVAPEVVRYRTGGMHAPGRREKIALTLPPNIDISPIPDDATLVDMLLDGEIDALYAPRTPRPMLDGDPRISRLFRDLPTVEADYFRRSRVFPVMHVVAIRRRVYEADRWIARSLLDAFETSRRLAMTALEETAALATMLPWTVSELDRTRSIMGRDFWRYGLHDDDPTIDTFLEYSFRQGLAGRRRDASELFAPETLDAVVI